ncbi:MAG TPA: glycosyltransferase family 2 protein [Candidatus Bipolaricaulota bacterium]|nr:glycosyltransferase family 2 protein [Candidatus Bipolaricaulota bacterium]
MKKLSIITVSWNVKILLIDFLKSIFSNLADINFEVIVVDNASKDGSVEAIKHEYQNEIAGSRLKILAEKENHGFSKGNNLGWQASSGEYVWFLNPDMRFLEDSAEKMLNFMKAQENVGAVGCRLIYADETIQPSVKNFPKVWDQSLILLKLHHVFKTKSLKRYLAKGFDYNRQAEVEQLMGACILIKRDVFEKIGGWDEDYWLSWEDVDLCEKLKSAGLKNIYTPITSIIHFEGKSFEQVPSLSKQKRFNKGMRTYFKKHESFLSYSILLILSPFSLFLAWLTQIFKVKQRTQSKI